MTKQLSAPLVEIDNLIRKGQIVTARRELKMFAAKKVARADAADFGLLAWRAKIGRLGIKVLNPIVRPPPRSKVFADEEEKAAYAACLIQIGANDEGLEILNSLDTRGLPQVLLLRVAAHVARWDYQDAIPLLVEYIASPLTNEYQKLVGKVNLASGYVYERRHAEASLLLPEIIESAAAQNLSLLYGNALTIAALNAIQGEDWKSAENYLKRAEEGLGSQAALDAFFVRKWNVVLRLFRDGAKPAILDDLIAVRTEAARLGHYETVRDCDHYRALSEKGDRIFAHVYCGTPFVHYRLRLLEDVPGKTPPSEYLWVPGGEETAESWFDLSTGKDERGRARLKVGDASLRLLGVLSADFYRPLRTAALHARLYPGDYYNPISSPVRVRQAIARLRRWVEENALPLTVEETTGTYRLQAASRYGIRIALEDAGVSNRLEWQMRLLRDKWASEPFSALQAAPVLGKSGRSARRILEQALASGLIERIGRAAATRYRFSAESARKAA